MVVSPAYLVSQAYARHLLVSYSSHEVPVIADEKESRWVGVCRALSSQSVSLVFCSDRFSSFTENNANRQAARLFRYRIRYRDDGGVWARVKSVRNPSSFLTPRLARTFPRAPLVAVCLRRCRQARQNQNFGHSTGIQFSEGGTRTVQVLL